MRRKDTNLPHNFSQAANLPRNTWNLKWLNGLKTKAEAWRRAAGLKTKDLDWDDVARVVCAGVGVLARDHRRNNAHWVFKKTMVRLEREFKLLKGPTCAKDALPDPKDLDDLEKLRRFKGGCASDDAYFATLAKELKWTRRFPHKPNKNSNTSATTTTTTTTTTKPD